MNTTQSSHRRAATALSQGGIARLDARDNGVPASAPEEEMGECFDCKRPISGADDIEGLCAECDAIAFPNGAAS